MNENGSFFAWLKHRWRRISTSDTRFFRFIWIAAITITLVTVLISAGVTAKANKKAEAEAEEKAKQEAAQKAAEEEAMLASLSDATAMDASATDADSWMLILVNKEHALPEGYTVPEFTELRNGHKVDSRIYPDLQQMFDDARAQGYSPYITSSYRTKEEQQAEMDNKVNELMEEGKTKEQCIAEAAMVVAEPGKSEHETGLAIDVGSDVGEAEQTALWTWFNENSYKYGFIIRYPEGKEEITEKESEPWHLRYVGIDAATEMYNNGLCLEEYLGY